MSLKERTQNILIRDRVHEMLQKKGFGFIPHGANDIKMLSTDQGIYIHWIEQFESKPVHNYFPITDKQCDRLLHQGLKCSPGQLPPYFIDASALL
jgi:hypothetical protein